MEQWLAAALGFLKAHADLAGPGLCFLSFASALFLVGVMVPLTATMLGAGAAVALDQWQPSTALWAMGGLIAGSLVSYELGRRLPESSRIAVAKRAPRWFAAADQMIGRYGAASVVVSRFLGPPATVPFLAGYLGLSRPQFLIGAAISTLWVPTVMAIGYAAALGTLRWT